MGCGPFAYPELGPGGVRGPGAQHRLSRALRAVRVCGSGALPARLSVRMRRHQPGLHGAMRQGCGTPSPACQNTSRHGRGLRLGTQRCKGEAGGAFQGQRSEGGGRRGEPRPEDDAPDRGDRGVQSEALGLVARGPESGEQVGASAHVAGGTGGGPGERATHRKYFQNPDADWEGPGDAGPVSGQLGPPPR